MVTKFRGNMKIEIKNNLFLTEYPDAFGLEIIERLTLPNPAYADAIKMRRWTGNLSPVLEYYHEVAGGLSVPRGCLDLIRHMAAKNGHKVMVTDIRRTMPEVDFHFTGKLRPFQQAAVDDLLLYDFGTLNAPTVSGKTVMALGVIAARKQPTIIIVHTQELQKQWTERIETFTGIPAAEIGQIGGGVKMIKPITVGIVNSVYLIAAPILRYHFGQIIVDECFPAGTSIETTNGPRPIEEIKTGDIIFGYDHITQKVKATRVRQTFQRQSQNLVSVIFQDGRKIECTAGHPFYDGNEYVPAQQLKRGQSVWRLKDEKILQRMRTRENKHRFLLPGLQEKKKSSEAENFNCTMLCMRAASRVPRSQSLAQFACSGAGGQGLLFTVVCASGEATNLEQVRGSSFAVQSKSRSVIKGFKQSHEEIRKYLPDACHKRAERNHYTSPIDTGRERASNAHSTEVIGRCTRMADGGSYQDCRSYAERGTQNLSGETQLTYLLQDRYCRSCQENWCRGGWCKSQRTQANPGCEKDKILESIRVECVAPVEPTDTRRPGGMRADGIVYNIETESRNYFAGGILVHNCHRAPSRTFTEAVTAFDCKYMLGLSATPYRRDGLTNLIAWHLGPCRHSIDRAALENSGDIVPADVVIRYTRFRSFADPAGEYTKMLSELTQDQGRNDQIAADVIREARNGGGVCLVLTDRKEHAETLTTIIQSCGVHADQLTGDLPARDRQNIVERLNTGRVKVIVATGQLIGEGFDVAGLSTLFMATPISYHGRLIQYLGRVLRPAPGKARAKVFDYVDPVGVLQAQAKKRQDVYETNKWRILQ